MTTDEIGLAPSRLTQRRYPRVIIGVAFFTVPWRSAHLTVPSWAGGGI